MTLSEVACYSFADSYTPLVSTYASMISKLETISAVGLNVAATLQYFVSESSIACATDFSEIFRPVTTWCTSILEKLRGCSSRRSPCTSTRYSLTSSRFFCRMPITSTAVQLPRATSRSSIGRGSGTAGVICVQRHRVFGWSDTDEKIVAGKVNNGLGVMQTHCRTSERQHNTTAFLASTLRLCPFASLRELLVTVRVTAESRVHAKTQRGKDAKG